MHVELKIEIVTKVVHYSGKWYHWTYYCRSTISASIDFGHVEKRLYL